MAVVSINDFKGLNQPIKLLVRAPDSNHVHLNLIISYSFFLFILSPVVCDSMLLHAFVGI